MYEWLKGLLSKVIRVNDTEMVDRPVLRLIAGDGVELAATDSAVAGETRIVVSATGGYGGSGNVTGSGSLPYLALWASTNSVTYSPRLLFSTTDNGEAGHAATFMVGGGETAVSGIAAHGTINPFVVASTGGKSARLDVVDGVACVSVDQLVLGNLTQTVRLQDGALITRYGAGAYRAELITSTTVASTNDTTVASLHLENSTTAVVSVVLHGTQGSDASIACNVHGVRLGVRVDGSGNVTVVVGQSTHDRPDGLPTSPPAWVGANYTGLIKTSVSANTLNIQVDQATSTSVEWVALVDALVRGA